MGGVRIVGLCLLVIMLASILPCSALTEDDLKLDLASAYEVVVKAEAAGGDVHNLVSILDEVARMIPGASEMQLSEAKVKITLVLEQAPLAETLGEYWLNTRLYLTAFVIMIIITLGLLLWWRGSQLFWRIWLRSHKGWRVEWI